MKKRLSILTTLALAFTLGLTGCAPKTSTTDATASGEKAEKKTITVGANPVPHAEILNEIKPLLAKEGYELKIKEFTDYIIPNTALSEGELDANFFQHVPYLEEMNKEKNLGLTYTVKVHIEPMGIYSSKLKNLSELKEGATIAIPNDATNGARALRVLETAGLIKLKAGDLISAKDITENPKKLKVTELDAPQLPRILSDVDAAVINTNYALEANLNPTKDALVLESKDSPYANILAVKATDKDKAYIQALSKALTSTEVKKFIEEKYKGAVVPAFN